MTPLTPPTPAIGRLNTLRVLKEATPGLYLDAGELGEVLLPRRYIPENIPLGAELEVFLHRDSEDRLVATTETPLAMVGDFACLRVVSVNPRIGAFLDWGLTKDLLLPHRAQADPVQAGEWIVVHVHLDDLTGRIIASSRLHEHLALTPPAYAVDQSVALLIVEDTPLGYRAIIEGAHWGLLYRTELSGTLTYGEKTRGFIKEIRPDGKIALRLDPAGYQRVAPLAERILIALRENGGRLEFDDASTSDAIRAAFGVSKKSFKQALGSLYRDRRIRFAKGGTELARR